MITLIRTWWQRLRHHPARPPQHSATTAGHRTRRIDTTWLHTAAHPADVDHIRPVGRDPVNQRK